MPFNPDEFLASKQAAQPTPGTSSGFDPDAFLQSQGVQTLPNGGGIQNGESTAASLDKQNPATIAEGPAQSFLDMAMPLNRMAEASGLTSGNPGLSFQDALSYANERAQKAKDQSPLSSLLAGGAGLVVGGFMGGALNDIAAAPIRGAVAKLTADETANAATQAFTDLAGLTLEGGSISVLNDQPKTFEDALHSFSVGGSIALSLGLLGKGLGKGASRLKEAAGNAIEAIDQKLTTAAKAKQAIEIEQAQKGVDLKSQQQVRQETLLSRRENELDLVNSQLDKTKALVDQEPFINQRVATLPDKVNGIIDQHLNEIGAKKSQIVQQLSAIEMDPTAAFKTALDKLESINPKTLTPQAESARQQAIAYIRQLDQRLFDQGSPTDVFTGGQKSRSTSLGNLDKVHDQLQDLIFDKGFLQNAPRGTQINRVVRSFELDMRNQINGADPTGELAVYNEGYHKLRTARDEDALSLDNPRFFMQKAVDPHNPALIKRYSDFENNLIPEKDGGSFRGNPDSVPYQEMTKRFEAIRSVIDAEAKPAMTDYSTLLDAKSQIPSLENRRLSLENSVEANRVSAEGSRLSKENAQLNLQNKIDESPRNSLEALLPAKLRGALHFNRSINENGALVNDVKSSILQSAPFRYGTNVFNAGARGATTRLPSALGLTAPQPDSQGALRTLAPQQ